MISPELLRRHPFFGGFAAEELNELAVLGSEQALAAVIAFPRAALAALLEDDHFAATLMKKLAELVSRRLRDTQAQLLSLTARQHT